MIYKFTLEQAEQVFFTSDQHFGHENIIKFCERPYENVQEMDRDLVDRWNEVVSFDSIVFHLGDFCLGEMAIAAQYFEALNGHINIIGNDFHHDKRWLSYVKNNPNLPTRTYDSHPISVLPPEFCVEIGTGENRRPLHTIHCSHYPIGDWDRKFHGGIHLHGHSHGHYKGDNHITGEKCFDVGVDGIGANYTPVSFGALLEWVYECN